MSESGLFSRWRSSVRVVSDWSAPGVCLDCCRFLRMHESGLFSRWRSSVRVVSVTCARCVDCCRFLRMSESGLFSR